MSVRFLADDIWKEITATAKGRRGVAFVAVPYFGEAGSRLLPLRAGDTLLVNASEVAVKSGQTHPQALRRLLNKGVKLYTLSALHAKIYAFGTTVFIGSANASASSRDELREAVVRVKDPAVAETARRHILSLCTTSLLGQDLDRLAKLYRTPRRPGGGNRTKKGRNTSNPRVFLAQLVEAVLDNDLSKGAEAGEREAKSNRKIKRSSVEYIWRSDFPYRMDDTVIQVWESANGTLWVYPPAKVVNRKIVPHGKRRMTFVYLENPNSPRRRLDTVAKRLPRRDRNRIHENRLLPNDEFRAKLFEVMGGMAD